MFLLEVGSAGLSQFQLKLLGAYWRLLRAVRLKWSTSSLVKDWACMGRCCASWHELVWMCVIKPTQCCLRRLGGGWRWLANYLVKIGQCCSLAFYGADGPRITPPTAQCSWFDDYWANKRSDEGFHPYLFHFVLFSLSFLLHMICQQQS